jgi:hypothetical protein
MGLFRVARSEYPTGYWALMSMWLFILGWAIYLYGAEV